MQITVRTTVAAPLATVWTAYTTPSDIVQWNAASADWHTTAATVDLRVGGAFSSRMEAKDGSFGFDFAGTYTAIVPHERIEYAFGDCTAPRRHAPGGSVERILRAILRKVGATDNPTSLGPSQFVFVN